MVNHESNNGYEVFVSDKSPIAEGTKEHFNKLGIDYKVL